MKIVFTNLFCLLFIYTSGCSKLPEGPTPPENVTIPDKQLLVNISRQALARRLPDISFTNMDLRNISYSWYIGDLDLYTNEQFSVDFRVKNSKRKTDEDGESEFRIDGVTINVETDGRIARGGVSKTIETYRSNNEGMSNLISSQGGPIWGEPFYPVKINSPLPCPNSSDLIRISLRAIHRFMPTVNTNDLIIRNASFHDINHPEDKVKYVGFGTIFWLRGSIRTNITEHEVIIDREEVTVQISTNGQVSAKGVHKSEGSTRYNRDALPGPWRTPTSQDSIQTNPTEPQTNTITGPIYHVVEGNDDLFSIAMMYGISLGELKKANQLTNIHVKVGQLVRIPQPDSQPDESGR